MIYNLYEIDTYMEENNWFIVHDSATIEHYIINIMLNFAKYIKCIPTKNVWKKEETGKLFIEFKSIMKTHFSM